MAAPIVLQSQLPAILRGLSRQSNARPSFPTDGDSDDDDAFPASKQQLALPREIAALEKMMMAPPLGGDGVSLPLPLLGRCRGTAQDRQRKTAPLSCDTLCCPPDCDCGDCPECRNRRRSRRRDRRKSLRDYTLKPGDGAPTPSPEYLRSVAVPSKPVPSDHPLVVISLDGVLDARLPYHLSGGWTDVLARPYLTTFMEYLLSQHSPWSIVFFSSLSRKKALATLKSLKLPTGGPEKDERDGVVGLFARDDMRGWNGGELELKDLEEMWDELEKEEGVRWTAEDTIVLSDFPQHFAKQPANVLLVPRLDYKSTIRPRDDQFLLLMVAVLKDLETESNMAFHIQQMEWNKTQIWTSDDEHSTNERNAYLLNAARICADMRISITAFTGN
ncbi:hypothetical protein JCM10213_004305 [Rhodosporidiobolus nylandii]